MRNGRTKERGARMIRPETPAGPSRVRLSALSWNNTIKLISGTSLNRVVLLLLSIRFASVRRDDYSKEGKGLTSTDVIC